MAIVLYLEAQEELTNRVTYANALLGTGTTAQLIYDDQGPVTYIVDYIRDLGGQGWWGSVSDNVLIIFSPMNV